MIGMLTAENWCGSKLTMSASSATRSLPPLSAWPEAVAADSAAAAPIASDPTMP